MPDNYPRVLERQAAERQNAIYLLDYGIEKEKIQGQDNKISTEKALRLNKDRRRRIMRRRE